MKKVYILYRSSCGTNTHFVLWLFHISFSTYLCTINRCPEPFLNCCVLYVLTRYAKIWLNVFCPRLNSSWFIILERSGTDCPPRCFWTLSRYYACSLNFDGVWCRHESWINWQLNHERTLKQLMHAIAVVTVEPADKTSFVYNCMKTRLKGQYNGKWPISLVCES